MSTIFDRWWWAAITGLWAFVCFLLTPSERAPEQAIVRIRGLNVMLDADLARLYGVDVRTLNQAVKRNRDRFPSDFMFQLDAAETPFLRSQYVILRSRHGTHRKYRPYAFTKQGVAMLSSVLRANGGRCWRCGVGGATYAGIATRRREARHISENRRHDVRPSLCTIGRP